MKNIHVIATDKPSKLLSKEDRLTIVHSEFFSSQYIKLHGYQSKSMYITNDEEIKEGDYGLSKLNEIIKFHSGYDYRYYKKIILTTDQDLIKDGIQAIDDEFLEYFVSVPFGEIKEVEVREDKHLFCKHCDTLHSTFGDGVNCDICRKQSKPYLKVLGYKIIIPKGELKLLYEQIIDVVGGEDRFREIAGLKPKQHVEFINDNIEYLYKAIESFKKETLEESAKHYATDMSNTYYEDLDNAFKAGAKWQQENSYSEEEVLNLLTHFGVELQRQNKTKEYPIKIKEWFNQFKK